MHNDEWQNNEKKIIIQNVQFGQTDISSEKKIKCWFVLVPGWQLTGDREKALFSCLVGEKILHNTKFKQKRKKKKKLKFYNLDRKLKLLTLSNGSYCGV